MFCPVNGIVAHSALKARFPTSVINVCETFNYNRTSLKYSPIDKR